MEQVAAPLGVVGFVFEGRPNVFADAAGVIRGGNTVVFRIGSDALETAKAIEAHALAPALAEAGLPAGAAILVASGDRAAGLAMFADPRLALAVARGSGAAVAQLGAVARQAGTPVSLHGTGGAWLIAGADADAGRFGEAVFNSLDRKVCNTLNVCCIVRARADDLTPIFLDAARRAGERRGAVTRVHWVDPPAEPPTWPAHRADDGRPISARNGSGMIRRRCRCVIVESVEAAIALFNRHSPRFAASLIAEDADRPGPVL